MSLFSPVYELSLTKGYVSNWTYAQAIRELIQNAIDSDSPFIYEFIPEADGTVALRLNSEFVKLKPSTLLLGTTTKANSADSIGSFGEGFKIALLVLLRDGYVVEMLNDDLSWRPHFKYSKQFDADLLAIEETTLPNKLNKGLTFLVHGLSTDEHETVMASCLRMQDHIGAIHQSKYGDILLERPGKLYVGSLYICDTEMLHGYNFKPEYMRLERDRQTVSSWDLQDLTLKAWLDTEQHDKIAEMISKEAPDTEYARWGIPEIVKEECYRLFKESNPGAVVAADQTELKRLVAKGMTKVVVLGPEMYTAVSSSRSYKASLGSPVIAKTPEAVLTDWLADNRGEMRTKAIVAFKDLIKTANNWRSA